jgi:hypothetical protein
MSDDPRLEFLSRTVLAALTVEDRAQVLADLETYMCSQGATDQLRNCTFK